MKKINVTDEVVNDTVLDRFLVDVLQRAREGENIFEVFHLDYKKGPCWADVKLAVNGVEVDATNFANSLNEEFSYQVKQAARRLMKEKFDERLGKVHTLLYRAERLFKDSLNDILPGEGDEW